MNMTEVKTQDLSGPALDWAVAKAAGVDIDLTGAHPHAVVDGLLVGKYCPSSSWSQCGPLIEKVRIGFGPVGRAGWVAHPHRPNAPTEWLEAEEPLVAICRAIVTDILGMVVSVPAELLP